MSQNDLHLQDSKIKGSTVLNLGSSLVSPGVTREGTADVDLGTLTGESVGVRYQTGELAFTFGSLTGDTARYLEPLTGDGLSVRHELANADYELEPLIGDSVGVGTHAYGIIPYICSVQSNAKTLRAESCLTNKPNAYVLRGLHCINQGAGDTLLNKVCYLSDNALMYRTKICSNQVKAIYLQTVNCFKYNNTPTLRINSCANWGNSQKTTKTYCIRNNNSSTLLAGVCIKELDISKIPYNIVNTYYPLGLPFTPNDVYKLSEYDVGFVLLSVRPAKALSGAKYKISYRDFSTENYELNEYARETFYIDYPTFPPENVELPRTPAVINYARALSAPYERVEYLGIAPLSNINCITLRNNVTSVAGSCIEQAKAKHLYRNTCVPYDDHAEIVEPPIPPIDPPATGTTFTVPIQDSYVMLNDFEVKMPDGTVIELGGINLSVSSDSFAWNWSSTLLDHSKQSILTPANDGSSIIVIAKINGYEHHLLVEKLKKRRSFDGVDIQISGRGLSALLDSPYQIKTSLRVQEILTNQQLALEVLPNDWSLVWDMPLWNVPAGTYHHVDKTPIQALKDIVIKCGGMIIPSRITKTLRVVKRYPVTPWYFGSVSPDVVIPEDVILEITEEPNSNFGANGVWVNGLDNGKQALVRISGTAGTKLAETQNNELMVDSVALRTLGERVLAGAHVQPVYNDVRTPLDSNIVPLMEVGMLLKLVVDSGDDRGIVNSVRISVSLDSKGATAVHQTMTIGEASSNLFSKFSKLIPVSKTRIGKSLSQIGNTHTIMEFVGTQDTKIRGTGTVGTYYYVTDGVITGEAPPSVVISDIVV